MRKYAIIVAGGTGKRFGSSIPKQFLTLRGRPVLYHTLNAFYEFDKKIQLIVTLPSDYLEFWESLIQEYKIKIPHMKVLGGETRFHSVKNGLNAIAGDGLVAVHDAVRPLVSQSTLQRCFETAAHLGNAVPTVVPVDSLRKLLVDESIPVDRNEFVLIQTPQVFDISKLKQAYSIEFSAEFTDDATVFERAGHRVILVEGNRENIKITTQTDLAVAEALFPMLNK
ncbi:MAG: 2-C-methyl-D-erythritol 4-phosphate cytidylyltransferase [Bacteroidales bacterium]|nr:2-C-methyl-D-erythritol 4-phosphate cytidylyltransferase [Bacteroidales bacterium]